LICYVDPLTATAYEFLTNELEAPPGVLAELYRRRWTVEKVFDQVKNKLGQQQAWGSSLGAKETQAQFIVLTHNLLVCYEDRLEKLHGVTNAAEDERRDRRASSAGETAASRGSPLSPLVVQARRATQSSVKFLRWLRHSLRAELTEATALLHLRLLYAQL
jgi:hypothetical protein